MFDRGLGSFHTKLYHQRQNAFSLSRYNYIYVEYPKPSTRVILLWRDRLWSIVFTHGHHINIYFLSYPRPYQAKNDTEYVHNKTDQHQSVGF